MLEAVDGDFELHEFLEGGGWVEDFDVGYGEEGHVEIFFWFFFEMYENLQKESKKIEFHQK